MFFVLNFNYFQTVNRSRGEASERHFHVQVAAPHQQIAAEMDRGFPHRRTAVREGHTGTFRRVIKRRSSEMLQLGMRLKTLRSSKNIKFTITIKLLILKSKFNCVSTTMGCRSPRWTLSLRRAKTKCCCWSQPPRRRPKETTSIILFASWTISTATPPWFRSITHLFTT